MTNNSFNLGIINESRIDESRTPLIPKHIKELKKLFLEKVSLDKDVDDKILNKIDEIL